MTVLSILTESERTKFDSPPEFTDKTREEKFRLNHLERQAIDGLLKATNKVGFMLQLIYFKNSGKFYNPTLFKPKDIEYCCKQLSIKTIAVDIQNFNYQSMYNQQKKIVSLLGWKKFDDNEKKILSNEIIWHVNQQNHPRDILKYAIDFLINNKIEVPVYYIINEMISIEYGKYENILVDIIAKNISTWQASVLEDFIKTDGKSFVSGITFIKKLNQSLRVSDINDSIMTFRMIKAFYDDFKPIINKLNISPKAANYYATWVSKSKLFQLKQFKQRSKAYLYVLVYIAHQYYIRHDYLVDILVKTISIASNKARNKADSELGVNNNKNKGRVVKKLNSSYTKSSDFMDSLSEIVDSTNINEAKKIELVKKLIDEHKSKKIIFSEEEIDYLEQVCAVDYKNRLYLEHLNASSVKMQLKVSIIVKALQFDEYNTDDNLLAAISHLTNNTDIKKDSPSEFLSKSEKEFVFEGGKNVKKSLYKGLLFCKIVENIKSGGANLACSYRYQHINNYLINSRRWNQDKESILSQCGLTKFTNPDKILDELAECIELKLSQVNKDLSDGTNKYLGFNNKLKIKVATPKTDSKQEEFISTLLSDNGYVPILDVLSAIDVSTEFGSCFKHHGNKNVKMKPTNETIFAGIIGRGCNIGINRMANISKGITEDILKNTVNWFFTPANLQSANNAIISTINKLTLPHVFKTQANKTHTSSDGMKMNISVDSIHANYSFKYFGKDQGVSIYSFIDDRHVLFYETVISPTEREAAYVIDGLMSNTVIKSDIHSTDTHGFTEMIFGVTHMIGTSFAPRIKGLGDQIIYSFKNKGHYKKLNYTIIPNKKINTQIIKNNWNGILRFIATILKRNCTASQLFKRLSSYAKEHPLYKALKEFGRIIKSIYILTYINDVNLRQRVEKQLNKIESSNKFSRAVYFANNQEFREGTKEEQEITIACRTLIQNCIILWNYLYLTQLLLDTKAEGDRANLLDQIRTSSIVCWGHINLHGEYDFTKTAGNDDIFDMEEILRYKIGKLHR
jgi:TnpA family transposase